LKGDRKLMTYKEHKDYIRQAAIDWQIKTSNRSQSYEELATYQAFFEKQAKRYGLLKEFRENAIC